MFDLTNLQSFWNYLGSNLASNPWVVADVVFLGYSLWSVLVHFNTGFIGVIFKFLAYVAGYFATRAITMQVSGLLNITDSYSILLIAVFVFVLSSYVLYKFFSYIGPGTRSYWFLNGLLGGIYGMAEVLAYLFILNTACIIASQSGFSVPRWVLIANNMAQEDNQSPRPPITYAVVSYYANNVPISRDQVNGAFEWLKGQFSNAVSPFIVPSAGTSANSAQPVLSRPPVQPNANVVNSPIAP